MFVIPSMRRVLHRLGFTWKRMRKSLASKRDEDMFRLFAQEKEELTKLSESKEVDLCYFDGAGFNLNPNVPYAWSPVGTQAILPAERSRGYTVLGILNVRDNDFEGDIYEGAANSDAVMKTLGKFAEHLKRKTIVILDNASIHKSSKVMDKAVEWRKKGLYLQFIPPYCPELNLIEILWHRMKHQWLKYEHCATLEQLRDRIIDILQKYGKDYSINFR
ncbi:MAG: IS630 family transposase [Bacteroidota bacterium]